MKKTILALATAATVAMGVVAAPQTADARMRWWPGAVIGGLAAGAIIGGAIANRGYYDGGPYAYDSYAYYGEPYAYGGGPAIWGGGRRVYSGPYGAYGAYGAYDAYGAYGVAPAYNDKYGYRNEPAP